MDYRIETKQSFTIVGISRRFLMEDCYRQIPLFWKEIMGQGNRPNGIVGMFGVTYDTTNGVLFSADAFGSFRSLDGKLFSDEFNFREEWIDDARRYLTNIVGKYGPQVQHLLKKAAGLEIKYICPLHGPVWRTPEDIGYILDKYQHWSTYEPEEKGVMIVYGSMYGHTEQAAEILASKLAERGVLNTRLYDVSSTHVSYLISDVFKYSHLVLASVTYNLGIFPPMHNFLMDMKALNVQNRTVAIMENGSWAIRSGTLMRECLQQLKRMNILRSRTWLIWTPWRMPSRLTSTSKW